MLDPDRLPMSLPRTPDGGPPIVTVTLGERDVRVLIRLVTVGRVPLLLLDTNLEDNHPEDREVTARLYGGDQETRIRQEIVLGIGGLRALERMQWRPTIRHLNEGHAAFVVLERIRQIVAEEGLSFAEARERAAAGNVFTTHTPVPAGIDRFLPELLEKYLKGSVAGAGLQFDDFLKLGQEVPGKPDEPFSMAVLALRLSGHANAVSRLHAQGLAATVARSAARARRRRRQDPWDHQRCPPRHLDRSGCGEPLARGELAGGGPGGVLAPARAAARKAHRPLPAAPRR